MNPKDLGRLQRVDLREVWTSESSGFTPWLAQPENIKLVGDTIRIDLECEAQEKEVGPFRADILCKDTATDDWVLIENQLERTDHTHLGQLLTYAAGLEAVTIVWIAERFTEEHRAALDWLNEHTDEKINFFGLEVELWRIENSPVAPKFNLVCKPNDWTRSIQRAAEGELSELKQLQLRFWTGFSAALKEAASFLQCSKPLPQHWIGFSIGRTGFKLSAVASYWNSMTNTKGSEIRAELVIYRDNAKNDLAALEAKKADLEEKLGFPLAWHNPQDKTMCRLYIRQDADFLDETQWPKQFSWLREKLERMHKVFSPEVKLL